MFIDNFGAPHAQYFCIHFTAMNSSMVATAHARHLQGQSFSFSYWYHYVALILKGENGNVYVCVLLLPPSPKCCSSGEEHGAERINRCFVFVSTTVPLSSHAI